MEENPEVQLVHFEPIDPLHQNAIFSWGGYQLLWSACLAARANRDRMIPIEDQSDGELIIGMIASSRPGVTGDNDVPVYLKQPVAKALEAVIEAYADAKAETLLGSDARSLSDQFKAGVSSWSKGELGDEDQT
ncbi:MAG: hypothetical protein JWN38_1113 [Candidatus Saccharibacteria bacterium]|nr:hypothetical protein [Candidatus Saccharibacteria bacterium]